MVTVTVTVTVTVVVTVSPMAIARRYVLSPQMRGRVGRRGAPALRALHQRVHRRTARAKSSAHACVRSARSAVTGRAASLA
eukprot:1791698-Pleurochrysis_carterae.AAC.1